MPLNIGIIHFIGIGGIGMSGIAEVLHNLGYKVQGSDQIVNSNVKRLRQCGIQIFLGQNDIHLGETEVVVVSTAIQENNPEYIAARERALPIVLRAEMLAELMRFRRAVAIGGTHGKTTTTSLVATLLEIGGIDPMVINGGIINAYGTNTRMGTGDWMVVEADESDGSFLHLPADIVVVTNIDHDHLDYYQNFEKISAAFDQFVKNIPFYGVAVMCIDHQEVQTLVSHIKDRRIITYGENLQADVRFLNYRVEEENSHFDLIIHDQKLKTDRILHDLILPMPGRHNVANATAAVAVAYNLGVSDEAMIQGLASFRGVERRFTNVGIWKGVKIYDDYAHHPVEIRAVLSAARDMITGKLIAIIQPHRFSRLKALFDEFVVCFNDADSVAVIPVYAAGEEALPNINATALSTQIRAAGHRDVFPISDDTSNIVSFISQRAKEGDCVIFLGAGTITQLAYNVFEELEKNLLQT